MPPSQQLPARARALAAIRAGGLRPRRITLPPAPPQRAHDTSDDFVWMQDPAHAHDLRQYLLRENAYCRAAMRSSVTIRAALERDLAQLQGIVGELPRPAEGASRRPAPVRLRHSVPTYARRSIVAVSPWMDALPCTSPSRGSGAVARDFWYYERIASPARMQLCRRRCYDPQALHGETRATVLDALRNPHDSATGRGLLGPEQSM